MSRQPEAIAAAALSKGSPEGFDVEVVRRDFPILHQQVHGKPLVYLDNAASSQRPQQVIDAVSRCYEEYYANVHRGVHTLSQRSTAAYEGAREKVQAFLHAPEARQIVFVRGTTEAINLVASSYGRKAVGPGDEVLVTAMEHHSNIVPWQFLCQATGARLKVIPINDRGEIVLEEYERLLAGPARIVAMAHVSNALGTVNPVAEMVRLAHARGAVVVVDGAQGVPHLPVDVTELGCDFYAFSSHKVFGPGSIGVLYGRASLLEEMEPYQGGGEMIARVSFEKTEYNAIPHKFEAGTPSIADAIGLGVALEYLTRLGFDSLVAHEEALLQDATEKVAQLPGVRLVGTAEHKVGVLSFLLDGIHAHDVGQVLDQEGIAVRAGHHCAQPLMDRLGIHATARASFAFYNTHDEVDALVRGIRRVREFFGS